MFSLSSRSVTSFNATVTESASLLMASLLTLYSSLALSSILLAVTRPSWWRTWLKTPAWYLPWRASVLVTSRRNALWLLRCWKAVGGHVLSRILWTNSHLSPTPSLRTRQALPMFIALKRSVSQYTSCSLCPGVVLSTSVTLWPTSMSTIVVSRLLSLTKFRIRLSNGWPGKGKNKGVTLLTWDLHADLTADSGTSSIHGGNAWI